MAMRGSCTGADGKPATTNVGFIPYRKLDYKFVVEILDSAGTKASRVKVGATVRLRITPMKLDGTPEKPTKDPKFVLIHGGATACGTFAIQLSKL